MIIQKEQDQDYEEFLHENFLQRDWEIGGYISGARYKTIELNL